MLKKINQKIKAKVNNWLNPPQEELKRKVKVLCPPGTAPYFFKNVIVVAHDERSARRIYENAIKKSIKDLAKGTSDK